jgi:hypothetical protein
MLKKPTLSKEKAKVFEELSDDDLCRILERKIVEKHKAKVRSQDIQDQIDHLTGSMYE